MSNDQRDRSYDNNEYGNLNGNEGSYFSQLQGFDYSSSSNYMIESLMHGSMDYNSLAKALGFSPSTSEVLSSIEEGNNKSQVLQVGGVNDTTTSPPTHRDHKVVAHANSSVSFSSSDHQAGGDSPPGMKSNKEALPTGSEGEETSKKLSKEKKKKEKVEKKKKKKERVARFAFMTKSEVDQLEDGYRWRKYGQKAVKNSPYPRSYYRCTTQKCTVKKRVERSCQDPTIVITTYEGQHNHPIPAALRGSRAATFSSHSLSPFGAAAFPQELLLHMQPPQPAQSLNMQEQQQYHQVPHYGLLQDIVPPMFFKREP